MPPYGTLTLRISSPGASPRVGISRPLPQLKSLPPPRGSRLFGPADLTRYKTQSPALTAELGCAGACPEAALRAASPITYVTAATPPMLIMQGTADTLVPPAQAQELYTRLRAVGVRAQLILLPGLGQGFTGASPAELQHLLDVTFDFIDGVARANK